MSNQGTLRNTLLATTAAISLMGSHSVAQEATDGEDDAMDQIVVTGIKLQNRKAIGAKRDSIRVIDAVASDEIGALPDFNIGEALQRLPGVNVVNDQAEARFATIRGLNASYNYTTIDGSSVAVPDRNGRRVFMDVLPASFAERLEVVKSLTPDQEGSAIGGIINIVTPSAFDKDDFFFKIAGEIGRYSQDEGYRNFRPSGDADFILTKKFGSEENFGIVLTGNYFNRVSYVPQVEWGSRNYFHDSDGNFITANDSLAGNGLAVPRERRWYWYYNDRKRFGGSAKLEYAPSASQYYWLKGYYNKATDDENRQTDLFFNNGSNTQVLNQTPTSGTVVAVGDLDGDGNPLRYAQYLGQFDFTREVWGVQFGGDYDFANNRKLEIRANYTGSYFDNPENWGEWRNLNETDLSFNYQRADGLLYNITFEDPAAAYNFDNFTANRRQFDERQLDEDIIEFQVDFGQNAEFQDEGFGWKVGAKYRQTDRAFDENRGRYLPVFETDSLGNPVVDMFNSYTLAASGVLNNELVLQPPGALSNQRLVVLDPERLVENFEVHLAANPGQWRFDEQERDDNRFDYSLKEDVLAAYLMFTHNGPRHRFVAGARYEDTSVDATGRRQVDGVWVDAANSSGFNDFLPSANLSYDLSEEVILRAAYSKAIGRAPFNILAPVGESFNPDSLTLSRSNPDLKPRKADNFDLSAEWYFDGGDGILSVGVFHKRVKNEFVRLRLPLTVEIEGQSLELDVTQTVNSENANKIYGFEANLVKNLTFLPAPLDGLGIAANVTLLDTDFKLSDTSGNEFQLRTGEGQANKAYNLAVYYEQGPLSAKLAYNYQGLKLSRFINTSTPYRNRFDTPEEQLDFKAEYRINDHWSVTANLWNITAEGRGEVFGLEQELPVVSAEFGRAYFFGFTYRN